MLNDMPYETLKENKRADEMMLPHDQNKFMLPLHEGLAYT